MGTQLNYAAPHGDFATYLTAYYLFESDAASFEDIERADVGQVRYVLSGEGKIRFADGREQPYTPMTIFGPRHSASHTIGWGPIRVFGVGLLPAGWVGMTGLPADLHSNQLIDGATLFSPDRIAADIAVLSTMATVDEMADYLNSRAVERFTPPPAVPHWFIRAVDKWLQSAISPDIETLVETTGLSRRKIEKQCREIYGAPPKLLVRKYRALRTANAIVNGNADWETFVDEGYYDQSHFIREIKEFVGVTPNRLRDHTPELSRLTFGRAALGNSVAPLVTIT